MVAAFALTASASIAHAQEEWREEWREERHERMERLRAACEDGDERACWRLREMRREWREHEERREWREREERRERERDWDEREDTRRGYPPRDQGGQPPLSGGVPKLSGKEALCAAIRNNFNNCVARQQANPGQHINCNAWPIELEANHCL